MLHILNKSRVHNELGCSDCVKFQFRTFGLCCFHWNYCNRLHILFVTQSCMHCCVPVLDYLKWLISFEENTFCDILQLRFQNALVTVTLLVIILRIECNCISCHKTVEECSVRLQCSGMWHCVDWYRGTPVLEEHVGSNFGSIKWRKQVFPEHWYVSTKEHDVSSQKMVLIS